MDEGNSFTALLQRVRRRPGGGHRSGATLRTRNSAGRSVAVARPAFAPHPRFDGHLPIGHGQLLPPSRDRAIRPQPPGPTSPSAGGHGPKQGRKPGPQILCDPAREPVLRRGRRLRGRAGSGARAGSPGCLEGSSSKRFVTDCRTMNGGWRIVEPSAESGPKSRPSWAAVRKLCANNWLAL